MSYEIRPLEWNRSSGALGDSPHHWADIDGAMAVRVFEFPDGTFGWWCRLQFDIGSTHPCGSVEHGKQLAEAEWRQRLLPMLIEVEPNEAKDGEQ